MASVVSVYTIAASLLCFLGDFPPTVHTQTLTVTLLPVSTIQGQSATLTCTFSLDVSGALDYVAWRQRGTVIADFFGGAQTPYYQNGFSAPGYVVSRDDSMSTLTIASTQFSADDGEYSCRAEYTVGVNVYGSTATSNLIVYVLPSIITLSDSTGSYPSTGGTSYLVDGVNRQFTCEVPDINPGALFTWSLDGGAITTDNTVNVTGADDLTTSTSLATVSPAWSSHGKMLQCQASNKDGHAGMSISITLDIKVPPKTSFMSMYDSNGAFTPGGSVSVDQDASHTFTCQAQSRPAATIQWDVGSPSYQDSTFGQTTPGTGDGLVDTTRTWTFTPRRDNHRQDVRCVANTAESQQPYPYVMVTLNISGPPDLPVISGNAGSTSMTENDPIVLTCTADMGYPDDWTLVWSNGGSPVTGPTTSSSASGDRYSFNSTLDYTPRRQDNGNNITCTANRAPWIPGPVGSLGPIDVKFCASSLTVTGSNATAGSTVTLRCNISESSNPATTLTWSKGSVQLTTPTDQPNAPGDNGGRVTTVIYTTDVLDKTNNGDVYICCATNPTISSCVTPLCDMHTLNVRYPPDFTSLTQTPQTPVTEGSDVTLTCTVDANPSTVDITWKKEGSGDAFNPTNGLTSTLTLSDINREQAGYYTCTANNGVPTDNPADVVSTPITVIVQYEVNITNKAMKEVGVSNGDTAVLTCIAVGNPQPVMEWYSPNNTMITSDTDEGKFFVTNETSGGDRVFGFEVTSKLTIKAVDSQVDYGVYTCISSNGIGREDSLNITLFGTRRPDKPTRVEITERTAEILTVTWTPGYDGGETQSFRVSYIKTSDSTEVFTEETGGKTTSTATGLDDYTEYEIRVYAKNAIGESIGYGSTTGYTLPRAPGPDSGIAVGFNKKDGTVEVGGLKEENACIQLEVRYQGNDTWQECGACIESDQTVTLPDHCASSQKRKRRAVGAIEAVRSKLCIGGLCSQPADAKEDLPPEPGEPNDSTGVIVGVVVGVVVLSVIVVLGVYAKRKFGKHNNGDRETLRETVKDVRPKVKNPQEDTQSPYQDITELEVLGNPANQELGTAAYANVQTAHKAFPRDQLKIIKELGHGAFGQVLLAEASGITHGSKVKLVAVKTLKEEVNKSDKADMMRELDLMKKLPDHCNVVRLLGFCVEKDPPYIIVEYLTRGNLKDLLKDSRSKGGRVYGNLHGISKSLTSKDLMKFAKDAADGMAFISSQQCIHRDLAARNVLVAEDMTCKVSDFGLARDVMNIRVYERGSEGALPMRWMALESILDDVYTTESDVWSYGVLLWEIVTLGARPYPAMTAKIMVGELRSGYRMPKPQHCQEELYVMMLRCWDEDPESRPTFKMISKELSKLINKGKEYISIKDFQETVYEVVLTEDAGEKF
ncbi:tyrosine-protein kinase Mer-like [Patiria miniata]|uniref:receptor protein-tyrosine kinase n=1 Tax=Patiria miniata TaxID=46514 RepID=A0A914ANE6_PATMI|nr:tyrosine-protein kinase Mer-like [Patiria miniata]